LGLPEEPYVKKRYERIVFPGRFQPVHTGHVNAIKWVLSHSSEIIIVVGSAQKSHTYENPFTAGERILMLKKALEEEGVNLGRVYILPVPDIEYNSLWVYYLKSILPPFDGAASRNPLVIRLFKDAGFDVIIPPPFTREKYSGKHIRKLMYEGKNWERLVPPSVVKLVREFHGIQRMVEATLTDEVDGE
jgi:nicotinamide-nucleotide adenylyltransferase